MNPVTTGVSPSVQKREYGFPCLLACLIRAWFGPAVKGIRNYQLRGFDRSALGSQLGERSGKHGCTKPFAQTGNYIQRARRKFAQHRCAIVKTPAFREHLFQLVFDCCAGDLVRHKFGKRSVMLLSESINQGLAGLGVSFARALCSVNQAVRHSAHRGDHYHNAHSLCG